MFGTGADGTASLALAEWTVSQMSCLLGNAVLCRTSFGAVLTLDSDSGDQIDDK